MKINLLIIGLVVSIFTFTGVALAHNDNQCHSDECHPIPTPTPTIKVTCTPTPTIQLIEEDTPTAGESATPTASPSATETPQPTDTPHGDGLSDGKSSCPSCTQAHNIGNVPALAPATGRAEE